MLEQLMFQLGLPISSMLGELFSEEWTPLLIHEKGPVTGMPSPMIQKDQSKSKELNKTPPGLLLVGGTRCFGQAMD